MHTTNSWSPCIFIALEDHIGQMVTIGKYLSFFDGMSKLTMDQFDQINKITIKWGDWTIINSVWPKFSIQYATLMRNAFTAMKVVILRPNPHNSWWPSTFEPSH